jgi:hypothetical protein
MCADLVEGCDEPVEWRVGVVLCEPLRFSIDGVESARQVLFLAIVDCTICQQRSHSSREGFRTDRDAIGKDVVDNDVLSKLRNRKCAPFEQM